MRRLLFALVLILAVAILALGYARFRPANENPEAADLAANVSKPDAALTPGDVFPVTAAEVCVRGYSGRVRDVPESEKAQVYREYGIASHSTGQYEVDHLIPLEIGGSNAITNLWPEPAEPRPGFHEKDLLENALHDLACSGQLDLATAQHEVATDWYASYLVRVMHRPAPSPTNVSH